MRTRALGAAAAGSALLFALLTVAIVAGWTAGVDLTLTRDVQAVDWRPLNPLFWAGDQWDGLRQVVLGVATIAVVFLLDRRLGVLALFCAGSDGAWLLLEWLVGRPRPPAGVVHVVRHAGGGSYPSGHVVYYFWAVTLLALAIAPRLPRRLRWLPWLLAGSWLLVVALGRIDYGEHWPSDVLGGLLLGSAWTLGVLTVGASLRRHRSDPDLSGRRPTKLITSLPHSGRERSQTASPDTGQ